MEGMAVQQVGLKAAQKTVGLGQTGEKAGGSLAHLQTNQVERCGPLLGLAGPEHHQRNRVAARGHALGQRHHLPFRPAHAQRGEHVRDPHSTRTLSKDQVERS